MFELFWLYIIYFVVAAVFSSLLEWWATNNETNPTTTHFFMVILWPIALPIWGLGFIISTFMILFGIRK